MAADVGTDMGRTDLALYQFYGGKHRPLGAAGTEIRRPRRNIAERSSSRRLVGDDSLNARRNRVGINAMRPRLPDKRRKPAQHHFGYVFAAARQAAFAQDARLNVGTAQNGVDLLLDIVGRA